MPNRSSSLDRDIRRLSGALILLLLVLGFMCLFATRRILDYYGAKVFHEYTDDFRMAFLPLSSSDESWESVNDRLALFADEGRDSVAFARRIDFSVEDLNLLLSALPELREQLRITSVTKGGIDALVSLPFEEHGRIRYLNGGVSLSAHMALGILRVSIKELRVRGQLLPETYYRGLKTRNFADVIYHQVNDSGAGSRGPTARDFLWKVGSISLEEGRIVVTG